MDRNSRIVSTCIETVLWTHCWFCVLTALTHPEKAAKLKLLLFKPFEHVSELRPDNMTWQQALAAFERSTSARVRRLLQNVDQICRHEQAGIEHRKKRLEEMRQGRMPSGVDDHDVFHQFGMHRGDEADAGDEAAEIDAPDFGGNESARKSYSNDFRDGLELNLSNGTHADAGLHIQNTVQAAADSRVFDSLQSTTALSRTQPRPGRVANGVYQGVRPNEMLNIQQTVADELRASKTQRAASTRPDPTKPNNVIGLLPLNVQGCLPNSWKLELPAYPTPAKIADGFKLRANSAWLSTLSPTVSAKNCSRTTKRVASNGTCSWEAGFPATYAVMLNARPLFACTLLGQPGRVKAMLWQRSSFYSPCGASATGYCSLRQLGLRRLALTVPRCTRRWASPCTAQLRTMMLTQPQPKQD